MLRQPRCPEFIVDHNNQRSDRPGVALFDNSITRDAGWYSVEGEPPIPIRSAQELSSGAVWLLNIDDDAFRESGLSQSLRFRGRDYLRSSLVSIAAEQGFAERYGRALLVRGGPSAQRLSSIFNHVRHFAGTVAQIGLPVMQYRLGLRSHVEGQLQATKATSERDRQALMDACQRYTMSERQKQSRATSYEEKMTTFTRQRYLHARDMLDQMVPSGGWRPMPMMRQSEIMSHPLPLLIEAEVQSVDGQMGALINFGGSGTPGRVQGSPRRWLTSVEYAFLAPHANIGIRSVMEAEEYVVNPMREILPVFEPIHQLSYSALLLCENIWTAVYRDPRGRSEYTATAAWVASFDRVACAREALRLMERDPEIDVTQFGFGKVTVKTPPHGVQTGQWYAAMVGGTSLIPPAAIEGPASIEMTEESTHVDILQAVQIGARTNMHEQLDRDALEHWRTQPRSPEGWSADEQMHDEFFAAVHEMESNGLLPEDEAE